MALRSPPTRPGRTPLAVDSDRPAASAGTLPSGRKHASAVGQSHDRCRGKAQAGAAPSERSPSASSLPAGQLTPSRSAMAASAGGCRANQGGLDFLCVYDNLAILERIISVAEEPLWPPGLFSGGRRNWQLSSSYNRFGLSDSLAAKRLSRRQRRWRLPARDCTSERRAEIRQKHKRIERVHPTRSPLERRHSRNDPHSTLRPARRFRRPDRRSARTDRESAIDQVLTTIRPLLTSRIGQPDDVARVIAYLISRLSSQVTGVEWVVDGGALPQI